MNLRHGNPFPGYARWSVPGRPASRLPPSAAEGGTLWCGRGDYVNFNSFVEFDFAKNVRGLAVAVGESVGQPAAS
jgi:hypothetical protein